METSPVESFIEFDGIDSEGKTVHVANSFGFVELSPDARTIRVSPRWNDEDTRGYSDIRNLKRTAYHFIDADLLEDTFAIVVPEDHPDFKAGDPDREAIVIEHQCGCKSCRQFLMRGRVEYVRDPDKAAYLNAVAGCDAYMGGEGVPRQPLDPMEFRQRTGWEFAELLDEALLLTKDGRFICTLNCD